MYRGCDTANEVFLFFFRHVRHEAADPTEDDNGGAVCEFDFPAQLDTVRQQMPWHKGRHVRQRIPYRGSSGDDKDSLQLQGLWLMAAC